MDLIMNKIERHPQKDQIDQKILSGVPYLELSEWCKRVLNFDVSHMSIKRYADSAGLSTNRASSSDDDFECEVDDAITLEIPNFASEKDIREFTRRKITEAYALQTAIVTQKQRLYMQGKGKYPNIEISGLKTIASVLGFISDNKDIALLNNE